MYSWEKLIKGILVKNQWELLASLVRKPYHVKNKLITIEESENH